MIVAASTANFYPSAPIESLETVLAAGFRTVEIFLNAPHETRPDYIRQLNERVRAAGATVHAVHPYSSFMEPFFLFSVYRPRVEDGLELYKSIFEATAQLGARYTVIHGDKENGALPFEESAARFARLYETGAAFGVCAALENVVHFRSANPEYLKTIRETLGDRTCFVLDLKQARRHGVPPSVYWQAMRGHIVQVHTSDGTADHFSLPPGRGTEDWPTVLSGLADQGYDGPLTLELYRADFDTVDDLVNSAAFLHRFPQVTDP